VFGLAAVGFGVFALVWHDFNIWQQIRALSNVPHREILVYIVAAVEIFGGVAIQGRRTAQAGAIYLIFALLWMPLIIEKRLVFDRWGNFFEQFPLVSGALIVYASFDLRDGARSARVARIGYFSFGICVVSFTLEQLFYLSGIADFVPKWMPLGQMFWAITTTVAFALAAIALLSGRFALLAARLLTVMIMGFGLLVWLPAPFADRHNPISWAGNAENLAIAGAAWIVADYLSQTHAAKAA
jgi:drug/metabolite transporter superfamily protein YnfA